MFVGIRDLIFAKGRFGLIAAVVALITVLVGLLTGLTAGLAGQNVDAVLSWKADRMVVAAPAGGASPNLSTSRLTAQQVKAWTAAAGVPADSVTPVGISQVSASIGSAGDERSAGVAVTSGAPGAGTGPGQAEGARAPGDNETVLSQDAASALHAAPGDTVQIAGARLRIAAVTGTGHYAHVPLISVSQRTWQGIVERMGEPGTVATTLLVDSEVSPDASAAADHAAGTTTLSGLGALRAVGSFQSEIGSLGLMIALLLGIAALVIGAFFTVWTLQRKGDIAVLKALGTPSSALARDAIGQAAIVLIVGIAVGLAVVVGAGSAASGTVPLVVSVWTTLLPGAVLAVMGLLGAAAALRSVVRADPLTALGAAR